MGSYRLSGRACLPKTHLLTDPCPSPARDLNCKAHELEITSVEWYSRDLFQKNPRGLYAIVMPNISRGLFLFLSFFLRVPVESVSL
jgi:hypothetical protein